MATASSPAPDSSSEHPPSNLDDVVKVPGDIRRSNAFSAGNLQNIALWGSFLLSAACIWLGACLYFYVVLSRYFLPATTHYSRSLYFDYSKAEAVATTHFLPDTQYSQARSSEVAAAQARFLSSNQELDVWLELATPEAHALRGDELFQVVGELLSADGRVAGISSRPCLVRQRYWLNRTLRFWLNAPFVMLGMWDDRQDVRVPLFRNYREQAATPFVVFRATLQPRAGGGRLPQLYEATVHVQLRLGLLSRLLSLTTPGKWIIGSLASIAVFLMGGGISLASITLLVLWLLTKGSSAPNWPAEKPEEPGHDLDTDGDITDDESPSAPEMPSEFRGSGDYPAEISHRYKGTNSSKIGGFPSQSSIVSEDSTFGSQEPHVTFPPRQRGQKKMT